MHSLSPMMEIKRSRKGRELPSGRNDFEDRVEISCQVDIMNEFYRRQPQCGYRYCGERGGD